MLSLAWIQKIVLLNCMKKCLQAVFAVFQVKLHNLCFCKTPCREDTVGLSVCAFVFLFRTAHLFTVTFIQLPETKPPS